MYPYMAVSVCLTDKVENFEPWHAGRYYWSLSTAFNKFDKIECFRNISFVKHERSIYVPTNCSVLQY